MMTKPTQITIAFGAADPHVDIAEKLQAKHPHHLILVQAGLFLHAFNKSAYVLHTLKHYKLQLAGPAKKPHLIVGFPVANYKKCLWPLVNEHNFSYVVATSDGKLDICVSSVQSITLDTVSDDIVHQVIDDLIAERQLNTSVTAKALKNPNTKGFMLKSKAEALDTQLLKDCLKLPRDVRATWGENVRETMQRIMRNIYLYGNDDDKSQRLKLLSADIDLLQHYIRQAQALNRFHLAFEHRVGLVVELGRILGGLRSAQKARLD